MEHNCKNCAFGRDLPKEIVELSLRAQTDIVKAKVEAKGKTQRAEFVAKVVDEYPDLKKMHGGFSVTKKPTDVDGAYVACLNDEQLKDVKATKVEIVYKYYFSCSHFEAKDK